MENPADNLPERYRVFVDALFATHPWHQTNAYMKAFPGASYDTARNNASVLMRDPRVIAEVERRKVERREAAKLEADLIDRELALLATADPRELSEWYTGACRYCYGDGHRYQRTPAEFERDLAAYLQTPEGKADPAGLAFDMQGGVGFNPKREPHGECPECHGEGVGYEVFKDTRYLSPAAARLFAGVKRTRDGVEIKTRSQDKALEMIGRRLGLFRDNVGLSGPDGGPIPVASVSSTTTDPQEAARLYLAVMGAQ